MEITASEMYWILKLDDLQGLCIFCIVAPAVIWVAALFVTPFSFDLEEDYKQALSFVKKVTLRCAIIVTTSAVAYAFIPSTQQMAMIKVVPAIVKSDIAKEVSGDAKELYKLGVGAIKSKLQGK